MSLPSVVRVILRVLLANRAALIAENLALRQQLAVVSRTAKRPRLRQRDLCIPKTPSALILDDFCSLVRELGPSGWHLSRAPRASSP